MKGHLQHVRGADQPRFHQLIFLFQLHIPGEQQRAVLRFHGKDQGIVVFVGGVPGQGPQHPQGGGISQLQRVSGAQPDDRFAAQGGGLDHGVLILRHIVIDGRRVPGVHRDIALGQGGQTAVVILVAMGQKHAVQASHVLPAQQFRQGVVGVVIAAVDQVSLIVKSQQQAVGLVHVEGHKPRAGIGLGGAPDAGKEHKQDQKNRDHSPQNRFLLKGCAACPLGLFMIKWQRAGREGNGIWMKK